MSWVHDVSSTGIRGPVLVSLRLHLLLHPWGHLGGRATMSPRRLPVAARLPSLGLWLCGHRGGLDGLPLGHGRLQAGQIYEPWGGYRDQDAHSAARVAGKALAPLAS